MQTNLGGDRLGSGKKNDVEMHGFSRSTHDLSTTWKSTMASGTLVPYYSKLALPGDTWDIDLDCDVLTHPTIAPLFGSYKVQLDFFEIPIRLYQKMMYMNLQGIGLKMQNVKLPQVRLQGIPPRSLTDIDNEQINGSSIFSYLDIRGLGENDTNSYPVVKRDFTAIKWLGYWDIYKNYYANKQEGIGAVIHNDLVTITAVIKTAVLFNSNGGTNLGVQAYPTNVPVGSLIGIQVYPTARIVIVLDPYEEFDIDRLYIAYQFGGAGGGQGIPTRAREICANWEFDSYANTLTGTDWLVPMNNTDTFFGTAQLDYAIQTLGDIEPKITTFPLENIDLMKNALLTQNESAPLVIYAPTNAEFWPPYNLALKQKWNEDDINPILEFTSLQSSQEGLAIKTYQSDLFNNWLDKDWIDGTNGINEVTKITVDQDGSFTLDNFIINKKIYDMLNRISVSDGSMDAWQEAVYDHKRAREVWSPVYHGGLIKELGFQAIISTGATGEQPLGTLAGRGMLNNKKKGGHITIKVNEPAFLMGIISLTPRICYSQGNSWDNNLRTMDDLHKPSLDQIGFQDLITDQMAWFDTQINGLNQPRYRSAGKTPAWVNYMTDVDTVRGNFAHKNEQMYMVLNRRFEPKWSGANLTIKDLTTYIDPVKFNNIFAYTRRDAQNFWVQVDLKITCRRKISAVVMPNL